ncbi:class I SAM-dependent methyltransferase, partial [Helicobacter jaachi]
MMKKDNYLRAMEADKHLAKQYYAKSVQKTEQQKALESLLLDSINVGKLDANAPLRIADLACGGGTLSFHLAHLFPNAHFYLLD